jgi:hypothetical protein
VTISEECLETVCGSWRDKPSLPVSCDVVLTP